MWTRELGRGDFSSSGVLHSVYWYLFTDWNAWPLKMRPTACPETSVTNYQSTLRDSQREPRFHLYRGA